MAPQMTRTYKISMRPALFGTVLILIMMLPIFRDYLNTSPDLRRLQSSDIYHIWIDGKEIAAGKNPYSSIHGSDMQHNKKYSTYLPGFFLAEVLLIKFGVTNFEQFFPIWQAVVTILYCFIGLLIFYMVYARAGSFVLALFSAYFWLLGRWSLGTLRIWQIDFVAILFLLLACFFLFSRKNVSYLLLGCSLAVKQISIFALPIFIMNEIRNKHFTTKDIKAVFISFLWVVAVPLFVSLPFLYDDFEGFILSIFFSLTRNPGGLKMESIDQVMNVTGLQAKVPLFCGLLAVYWLSWKEKLSVSQAVLLSFVCFVTFNSVLFKQYLPWCSAFLGLAIADCVSITQKISDRDTQNG